MRAAAKVRAQPGISLVDVDPPALGVDDILVGVSYCGICGSDLPVYQWDGQPQGWADGLPRVMGHEFAGRVLARGERVDPHRWAEGTIVGVEPGVTCGECQGCLAGFPNLCSRRSLVGIDRDGAFAPFVAVPAVNAYPLSPDTDLRHAAFLEVFALAVHAVERARLRPVYRVLVVGAGPIGLSLVALARLAGCEAVEIAGLPQDVDVRMALAAELGATASFVAPEPPLRGSYDVVFEASGAWAGIRNALTSCRTGGRVVAVGTATGDVPVDWTDVVLRAIRVTPIRARLPRHWEEGARVLHRIPLPDGFFSTYPLEHIDLAFDAALRGAAVKVLVQPSADDATRGG